MPVNMYDSRTLMRVIDDLQRPKTFLLDMFFPFEQFFDTEKVDFDKIQKSRKLAPFVSPYHEGKFVAERGYTTDSYEPPYIKPKTPLDPSRPLKRRAGERLGGEMTPGARADAQIAQALSDQMDSILRRQEWMAASALHDGSVVVSGEGYPTATIDFGRDAACEVVLSGASRWGEAGVKPLDDIEAWAAVVQSKSGAAPTDVVMDPEAWKLARANTEFRDTLDNRRQSGGSIELGPVAVADTGRSARYVGFIGDFNFWVYSDTYEDDAGSEVKMMPDHTVLMGSSAVLGNRLFAAIRDPKADYVSTDMWPKMWIDDDPAQTIVMTQSAPLIVPGRPNASFRATVR